jgi:anti-anti-sigma factor
MSGFDPVFSAERLSDDDDPAELSFDLALDGERIWRLSGEIDQTVVGLFADQLHAALERGPRAIDLSGLRFIDCSGMRALAHALITCGDGVRVRAVPTYVRRHWAIAGFDAIAPLPAE